MVAKGIESPKVGAGSFEVAVGGEGVDYDEGGLHASTLILVEYGQEVELGHQELGVGIGTYLDFIPEFDNGIYIYGKAGIITLGIGLDIEWSKFLTIGRRIFTGKKCTEAHE